MRHRSDECPQLIIFPLTKSFSSLVAQKRGWSEIFSWWKSCHRTFSVSVASESWHCLDANFQPPINGYNRKGLNYLNELKCNKKWLIWEIRLADKLIIEGKTSIVYMLHEATEEKKEKQIKCNWPLKQNEIFIVLCAKKL